VKVGGGIFTPVLHKDQYFFDQNLDDLILINTTAKKAWITLVHNAAL